MYKFKLEGTFLERPILTLEGVPIPYKTFSACYMPLETVEGPNGVEVLPEIVSLQFTLSSKVGNLESNTHYRVKANQDGQLVFEQLPKEVQDALQQFVAEARKMKRPPCEKKEDPKEETDAAKTCAKCGAMMKDGQCTGKCKAKSSLDLLIDYATTQ